MHPSTESADLPLLDASELARRVGGLERELHRLRRSRRVLMELLWRLDRDWRARESALEAENRRLWAAGQRLRPRGGAAPGG